MPCKCFGGIGFTMDSDVGKLHADSLIMTIYEGTSEIQASFALREMGKGALAVVFGEARAELEAMSGERSELARVELEALRGVEATLQGLATDLGYALLRAKLMAEMVIAVVAANGCSGRPARIPRASTWPAPSSAAACWKSNTRRAGSARMRRDAWNAMRASLRAWQRARSGREDSRWDCWIRSLAATPRDSASAIACPTSSWPTRAASRCRWAASADAPTCALLLPKDDTAGCTRESCSFRDHYED